MKFDEASSAWIDKRSSWQFYACEMRMLRTRLSIGILTYLLFSASTALSLDLPDIEVRHEKRTGKVISLINRNTSKTSASLSALISGRNATASQHEYAALASSDLFLSEKGSLFGVSSLQTELYPKSVTTDKLGLSHIRYEQRYKSIPVYGGELISHLNSNMEVSSVSGSFLSSIDIDVTPKISEKKALKAATRDLERTIKFKKQKSIVKRNARKSCRKKRSRSFQCMNKELKRFQKINGPSPVKENAKLYIYNFSEPTAPADYRLVWALEVSALNGNVGYEYFIDAKTREILKKQSLEHHINRAVYDCADPRQDIGCYLDLLWFYGGGVAYYHGRSEGQPARGGIPVSSLVPAAYHGSTEVDQMYDKAEELHNFYLEKFGRDGGNGVGGMGNGLPSPNGYPKNLSAFVVHANLGGGAGDYCSWNGGFVAPNWSIRVCKNNLINDLLAHEYSHIVANSIITNPDSTFSGLINFGLSGSLTESNSDIMGEAFELHMSGNNDWLFGDPSSEVGVYRNLAQPGSLLYPSQPSELVPPTPYPDRYNSPNFYCGTEGGNGTHWNSTVPSKAAYLASVGGNFNGCTIEGIGLEKVEQIWYRALTTYYTTNETFNMAFNSINQACQDLAGAPAAFADFVPPFVITAEDCAQVEKALQAVEMDQAGFCSGIPGTTPACAAPQYSADFDFSGTVDLNDYQILRGRWSYPNEAARLLSAPPEGDANLDGAVDIEDYNIFVPQFINDNPGVTPPPAPTMVGDLNLDGLMNIDDYIQWLQSQGQTGPGLLADTDVNGVVDNTDLQMWASHYPTGNPADLNNDEVVDLWDYNAIRAQ